MQFVRHSPDIPERLLQAHEDGRVVFFCGAGISYPARLPGFAGLMNKVDEALAATPAAVQQAAINSGQFDTAIGLLEMVIVGGRETVRRALADISSSLKGANQSSDSTGSRAGHGTLNNDAFFAAYAIAVALPRA